VHSAARRARGVAITTCTNWFFNFIIGLITPPMLEKIGYGTFIFFGAFSVLSGLWTWFVCPETNGVTLEEMDRIFSSNTAHEELEAKHEILGLMIGGHAATTEVIEDLDGKEKAQWVESV